MGRFVKGDVVVTPFPFSDLQVAKRRPALVVTTRTLLRAYSCDQGINIVRLDLELSTLPTGSIYFTSSTHENL